MTPLLVQMSGAPGTGKSTPACAIAPQLHAVVLDYDLIKATLTVIVDSLCFYAEQLEAGQQVAADHGAGYRYVECVTDNLDVIAARLRTRTAYPTQYRGMDQVPATAGKTAAAGTTGWQQWIDGMKRLADRAVHLRVDTRRGASECAAEILRFLQAGTAG